MSGLKPGPTPEARAKAKTFVLKPGPTPEARAKAETFVLKPGPTPEARAKAETFVLKPGPIPEARATATTFALKPGLTPAATARAKTFVLKPELTLEARATARATATARWGTVEVEKRVSRSAARILCASSFGRNDGCFCLATWLSTSGAIGQTAGSFGFAQDGFFDCASRDETARGSSQADNFYICPLAASQLDVDAAQR
jgi:hypothetical protein